jgi:hypothetical protein
MRLMNFSRGLFHPPSSIPHPRPAQLHLPIFAAKSSGSGLDTAAALAQPWLVGIPNFVMRIVLTLIAPGLLVTACGRGKTDVRRQITGTWHQGPHTLTLAADGSYTSIFPGKPGVTFKGRWHIEREFLVVTDLKSNSVPMAGNTTVRIVAVGEHHLMLAFGTNGIAMTR